MYKTPAYDGRSTSGPKALLLMAGAAALLLLLDIAEDMQRGAVTRHIILEAIAVGLLGVVVIRLGIQLIQARRQSHLWQTTAEKAHADARIWQTKAESTLRSWHTQVRAQMDQWELTAAEQDVALGILQGKSFKELAHQRQVSERTVRQQAGDIYRKTGLRNRGELAAFFLAAPAASTSSS